MLGPALDARWCARRSPREGAWKTDARMERVACGGHTLRILDSGGASDPVIFAADAPVVLEHYLGALDVLARRRRVLVLEFPGFGFSTPSTAYRFGLAEQIAALEALLDAKAIGRATLAMSCVNALPALGLAARRPDRVERLVLSQIPSPEELANWARRIDLSICGRGILATPIAGQLLTWAAPSFIAKKWFEAALPRGSDTVAYAQISRAAYAKGGAFSLAAIIQALAGLGGVHVPSTPITIVWGEADRTHKRTDRASSRVWGPNVELISWADAGHCVDLEQPERFAALYG